ncbi:MAG: DUF885 domain-containing protein [Candidatus Eremiobacterota bacterium]
MMRRMCLTMLLLALVAGPTLAQTSDADFVRLSGQFMEEWLALNPERATELGDHRYDGQLSDYSPQGLQKSRELARTYLDRLAALDPSQLSEVNRVDYEILNTNLEYALFALDRLKEHTWNPLAYNPGSAIYSLVARDFAPPEQRAEALAARLEAIPRLLEQARGNLLNPPSIHTETAIQQNKGTVGLVKTVDAFFDDRPELQKRLAGPQQRAASALEEYGRWLEADLLPRSHGDFRLGAELYREKLRFALESDVEPAQILKRAEQDLAETHRQLEATARPLFEKFFPGQPVPTGKALTKAVLDRLAQERPNADTIVKGAREALQRSTEFTQKHALMTVPTDPIQIMVMPEFARGVAVAYCDSSGPLEKKPETFYCIAPPPEDWTPQRVESYFKEYNDYMLENLTVHEAVPGHYLQLMHANRFQAPTKLRAIFASGTFIEGWATYTEQLMVEHGFGGPEVRMQQLKMRLRLILNAIIDQKVHTAGLSEQEAMRLMLQEGFQEEGEAAGKWRRACLTSTQLSTYFVGNLEINDIRAAYERSRGRNLKEMHDRMLSYGSPAPKYVKRLMGLEVPRQP